MEKIYLSIDLESWAYPNIERFVNLDSFSRKEIDGGFVPDSINMILDLLAKYNQELTFFSLGEPFEWYPDAFEKIYDAGHEIAYHTHRHIKIESAKMLKNELLASKAFLSEFKPKGFRAPEIFLPADAIAILNEFGFRYSSSVYGGCFDIFKRREDIIEFPVSTSFNKPRVLDYPRSMNFRMLFKEIPFGAGYFFATLPWSIIEKNIEKYLKADKPVFMFIHNWQIVRPKAASFPNFKYKLLHPTYLPYTIPIKSKFERLLKSYTVRRMDDLL